MWWWRCSVSAASPASDVALVALGSNLEGPLFQLRRARRALGELGNVVACSSLYETAPIGGPAGQPNFLNAVVLLEPAEIYRVPTSLLQALHDIERQQGRTRRVRWDARSLDLDLLAYGERIMDEGLILPHPRMMARAFVLAPLCEVAPDWQHPLTGERACGAMVALSSTGIRKTSLSWDTAAR